jgi:O-antigen ligase
MQGPSVTAELALGAAMAFCGLYVTRRMEDIKRLVPYLGCIFVYIASAYYWKDHDNDLTAKYTLGLFCYLITAGMVLRALVDRGRGNGVLLGLTLFSLCLAAVGMEVLRTVGVETLVKIVGLGLSRSNAENESYTYLHFFTITNVIIGMSTFAISALAGIVVLSLDAPIFIKCVSIFAFGIALYINIEVLTRGAVVSAALGIVGTFPWLAAKMGLRRLLRYSAIGVGALAGLLAFVVLANRAIMENVRILGERISQTGDDARLTHWQEATRLIQRNPLGGGRVFMQTHTWAHNLFLDIALTAGLPGLLSVGLCLMLACLQICRVLLRGRGMLDPVFLVLLSQFLAVLVLSMTSPPSLPLFGLLLLVAGFFARPFRREDQQFA